MTDGSYWEITILTIKKMDESEIVQAIKLVRRGVATDNKTSANRHFFSVFTTKLQHQPIKNTLISLKKGNTRLTTPHKKNLYILQDGAIKACRHSSFSVRVHHTCVKVPYYEFKGSVAYQALRVKGSVLLKKTSKLVGNGFSRAFAFFQWQLVSVSADASSRALCNYSLEQFQYRDVGAFGGGISSGSLG